MRFLIVGLVLLYTVPTYAAPSLRRCERACTWAGKHCRAFGNPRPRRCRHGIVARCQCSPFTTTTIVPTIEPTTSTSTSTTSSMEAPTTLDTTTSTSTTTTTSMTTTTVLPILSTQRYTVTWTFYPVAGLGDGEFCGYYDTTQPPTHIEQDVVSINWADYANGIAIVGHGDDPDYCGLLDGQYDYSLWPPRYGVSMADQGRLEISNCNAPPNEMTGYEVYYFDNVSSTGPGTLARVESVYYLSFQPCARSLIAVVEPFDPSTVTTSTVTSTTTSSTGLLDPCPSPDTTSTTQPATCAGPTSAYVQFYSFCGKLVPPDCATGPFYTDVHAMLHIAQAGSAEQITGTLQFLFVTPAVGGGGTTVDVQGLATYPEWEVQGTSPFGPTTFWVSLDGLPRERAGCQQVAGALEARKNPDCPIRYEGTWTWSDN